MMPWRITQHAAADLPSHVPYLPTPSVAPVIQLQRPSLGPMSTLPPMLTWSCCVTMHPSSTILSGWTTPLAGLAACRTPSSATGLNSNPSESTRLPSPDHHQLRLLTRAQAPGNPPPRMFPLPRALQPMRLGLSVRLSLWGSFSLLLLISSA
ncbi:hypothetical protein ACRALDRAFT_2054091, partial [Sodiomyces alcalophilus JCM 7366]|uniref:uncharacterized protein n=1 Tax=Sodiomyces alcalophilus JCM 7366 TaxID=591952 RepID=UPI0039B5BE3B